MLPKKVQSFHTFSWGPHSTGVVLRKDMRTGHVMPDLCFDVRPDVPGTAWTPALSLRSNTHYSKWNTHTTQTQASTCTFQRERTHTHARGANNDFLYWRYSKVAFGSEELTTQSRSQTTIASTKARTCFSLVFFSVLPSRNESLPCYCNVPNYLPS